VSCNEIGGGPLKPGRGVEDTGQGGGVLVPFFVCPTGVPN